jgi:hypothetical protein
MYGLHLSYIIVPEEFISIGVIFGKERDRAGLITKKGDISYEP